MKITENKSQNFDYSKNFSLQKYYTVYWSTKIISYPCNYSSFICTKLKHTCPLMWALTNTLYLHMLANISIHNTATSSQDPVLL